MTVKTKIIVSTFALAAVLTTSGLVANAQKSETRPGWGYGDTNHVHTGPPGQSVRPLPNGSQRYKHTFNGGGGTFNVSMTEREIDYTTPSGGDLICKPNDIVVAHLGTMGTLTEADLLEAARNCQPNIFTLPHLVQAMREGKIFFGGSMLTLNPVTETPGGDDGDGEETPSYSPKITPSSATMAPGSTIDFKGTNFAHEEDVTVKRDGTTVGSAHADGGGNFTTGSMTVPSTPGTYTYTFTGETSATAVTSTITVS